MFAAVSEKIKGQVGMYWSSEYKAAQVDDTR